MPRALSAVRASLAAAAFPLAQWFTVNALREAYPFPSLLRARTSRAESTMTTVNRINALSVRDTWDCQRQDTKTVCLLACTYTCIAGNSLSTIPPVRRTRSTTYSTSYIQEADNAARLASSTRLVPFRQIRTLHMQGLSDMAEANRSRSYPGCQVALSVLRPHGGLEVGVTTRAICSEK